MIRTRSQARGKRGAARANPAEAFDDEDHPRESSSGRVLGITARTNGKDINVRARKGVFVGTGGGNVNFRRTFDPRLTEEYQQACALRASERRRGGDGHGDRRLAVGHGTADIRERCRDHKDAHIGCQWGYGQLVIETDSPIFHLVRATGLTVANWQDVIMVNQTGKRFWNESMGATTSSLPRWRITEIRTS